jgi:hypothetical protein
MFVLEYHIRSNDLEVPLSKIGLYTHLRQSIGRFFAVHGFVAVSARLQIDARRVTRCIWRSITESVYMHVDKPRHDSSASKTNHLTAETLRYRIKFVLQFSSCDQ